MKPLLLCLVLVSCGDGGTPPEETTPPATETSPRPSPAAPAPVTDDLPETEPEMPRPKASYVVFPNVDEGGSPIGNTGLAVDPRNGNLYHARYDFARSAKVSVRTRLNRELQELDLTDYVDHIQGLAFAPSPDRLFVWGLPKGVEPKPWSDRYRVFVFSLGAALPVLEAEHEVPASLGYPGALAYGDGVLWLKANGADFAVGFKAVGLEFREVETVHLGVKGEGLAVDGAYFWTADKLGVYRHDASGRITRTLKNPTVTGASEGLALDPAGGGLWLSADEGLHGNHPDGNRVYRVEIP